MVGTNLKLIDTVKFMVGENSYVGTVVALLDPDNVKVKETLGGKFYTVHRSSILGLSLPKTPEFLEVDEESPLAGNFSSPITITPEADKAFAKAIGVQSNERGLGGILRTGGLNLIEKNDHSTTGSLRFNSGKSQTNEIDPSFILGMGQVLEKSRQKYPRGNWQKGNNYSVPWDSLQRHLLAWQSGEKCDSESGLPHLHHAALNLMMLAYYEENYPEMDDRLFKKGK